MTARAQEDRRPHLPQVHQLRLLLAGALPGRSACARAATTPSCSITTAAASAAPKSRCALQPKLPERTPRRMSCSTTRRRPASSSTRSRALPLSRRFSLHEPGAAGDYDAIVVGSDEVWNFRHPWYGSKPIFFGDGLKADRLVSYARELRQPQRVGRDRSRLGEQARSLLGDFGPRREQLASGPRRHRSRSRRSCSIPCLLFPDLSKRSGAVEPTSYAAGLRPRLPALAQDASRGAGRTGRHPPASASAIRTTSPTSSASPTARSSSPG